MDDVQALRDLLDERDRRYEQRFASQEKNVATANVAMEKRLDGLNELRSGVATKDSLDALAARVDALSKTLEQLTASSIAGKNVWGFVVGGFGIVAVIVAVLVALV